MHAEPILEFEGYALRRGQVEDAAAAVDYFTRNQAHVAATSPRRPEAYYTVDYWHHALIAADTEFREDRSVACFLFEGPRIVGTANLSNLVRGAFHACHLGYSIDAARQGRGLMGRAVRWLVEDYAFGPLGLHRVMANYMPDNERSARLLQRRGFTREGFAKDYLLINGEWRDHVLTARVNERWTPPATTRAREHESLVGERV